ncbi:MAG: hypothetical protein R3Y57_04890, partial [Erysipelotrichaceae bacterium]
MKKIIFFVPAIIFTILYGVLALSEVNAISTMVIVWLILFWIAGTLLSKSMFWGGLMGIIPAVCFIYMGTQETGQIISETPIGIVVLLYYAICAYCVYRKSKLKS